VIAIACCLSLADGIGGESSYVLMSISQTTVEQIAADNNIEAYWDTLA
jgi:hypothetical protein